MKTRLERGKRMKKKGFTLIELLAVIVILAIIALIAVPTVMNIINRANKSAFKDSAYGIIKAGELFYTDQLLENAGNMEETTFDFPNNIKGLEFKGSKPTDGFMTVNKDGKISIAITNGKYCVTKGFEDDDVTITNDDGNCGNPNAVKLTVNLNGGKGKTNYKNSYEAGEVVALTVPTKEGYSFRGWEVTGTGAKATKSSLTMGSDATTITAVWQEIINCTYDGELVKGAEFTHNQYTYRYKQEYTYYGETTGWIDMESDGWGVILTDKSSTEPVNTPLCTYINGKPLVSTRSMFTEEGEVYSQTTSVDVSNWNTSTVTSMIAMFANAGYDVDTFSITGLDELDTSNVTDMYDMFSYMGYYIEELNLNVDLSSWDVSNVTDMSYMFYEVGKEATNASVSMNLSGWDTSNVTSMYEMFYDVGSYADTVNIEASGWNVSSVTDLDDMFGYIGYEADTVNIEASGWDLSSLTNVYEMFYDVGGAATTVNLDLSGWDTSNVTDMTEMFYDTGWDADTVNLDLSGWDTSNVTDMIDMFYAVGEKATTFNLTLGNEFGFLPDNALISGNWVKTYDVDGNALNDTTQYTTEQLTSFTGSTTPSIGGTWVMR